MKALTAMLAAAPVRVARPGAIDASLSVGAFAGILAQTAGPPTAGDSATASDSSETSESCDDALLQVAGDTTGGTVALPLASPALSPLSQLIGPPPPPTPPLDAGSGRTVPAEGRSEPPIAPTAAGVQRAPDPPAASPPVSSRFVLPSQASPAAATVSVDAMLDRTVPATADLPGGPSPASATPAGAATRTDPSSPLPATGAAVRLN